MGLRKHRWPRLSRIFQCKLAPSQPHPHLEAKPQQWCTDLGMEPLLAVWSGMYLDPSNIGTIVSEADLAPYVELAMNELEFILGPVTSTYGSIRASLGYPEPWKLNYVEIGNEDNLWDGETSYVAYRFNAFFSAIHAKYPWITVISSTGDLEATGAGSATDYHIYTRPDDFVSLFGYWDNAPRTNKVLVGEYANIQGNVFGEIVGTNWSAPRRILPCSLRPCLSPIIMLRKKELLLVEQSR
jgi:alpha-N-arabinofuranosidase